MLPPTAVFRLVLTETYPVRHRKKNNLQPQKKRKELEGETEKEKEKLLSATRIRYIETCI